VRALALENGGMEKRKPRASEDRQGFHEGQELNSEREPNAKLRRNDHSLFHLMSFV
jgi:hypothetical protein